MREIKLWDKLFKEMFNVTMMSNEAVFHATPQLKSVMPNGVPLNQVELMQYTGLKDKNGKEIYEGDLIKSDKYKYPHKVKYTLGSFVGEQVKGKFEGYADGMFFAHFEVIGNIYENTELLGASLL